MFIDYISFEKEVFVDMQVPVVNRGIPERNLWMAILKRLIIDIKPAKVFGLTSYYSQHTLHAELNGYAVKYACEVLDIAHDKFCNECIAISLGKRDIEMFNDS